jgi:hypothetical protein
MKRDVLFKHALTAFMSLGSYLVRTILTISMKRRLVINDDLTTCYKYDWKRVMLASVLLNLGMGLGFVYMANLPEKIRHVYHSVIVNEQSNDMALTDSGLTAELVASGVLLPNVAVAQATIESGLGKSKVGREAKNLFGIVFHRCQHVAGQYGVYAKYNSYKDNVKCYAHIQQRFLKNIDGKYAESPLYVESIKSFK